LKYDYSYLRGFIKQHFGRNQDYADYLGISATSLYDRLSNRTPFSQDEIDKTAQFDDLSGDDLMRLFFTKEDTENRTILVK